MTNSARFVAIGLFACLSSWAAVVPATAQSGPVQSAPGRIEIMDSNDSGRQGQWQRPPATGRRAAQKYMNPNAPVVVTEEENSSSFRSPASGTQADRYLALHLGAYVDDDAYKWGVNRKSSDVGEITTGVTYRIGEWENSMDLALRLDVSTYSLTDGKATKVGIVPLILFPDASSRFPLYFGGGLGLGVMAKQLNGESSITLDYQLLLGARFFEVFQSTGFFIEAGIKNHFLLFSDGQFNGAFISAGTVFTF